MSILSRIRDRISPRKDRSPRVVDSDGSKQTAKQWAESGEWASVISSNVGKIRYDELPMRLDVIFFARGRYPARQYYYLGVPKVVAMAMYNAPSMGKFVWQHLRGKYPYSEVVA